MDDAWVVTSPPFRRGARSAANSLVDHSTATGRHPGERRHRRRRKSTFLVVGARVDTGGDNDDVEEEEEEVDYDDDDEGDYSSSDAYPSPSFRRRQQSQPPPIATESDSMLDYAIDSFLRGDYAYQFSETAPFPSSIMTPGETVQVALRALRNLDQPEPAHGAAVLMRFCTPLSRSEMSSDRNNIDPWKQVLRGALTPEMLAKGIRASPFAGLLDWTNLDVTEGTTTSSSNNNNTINTNMSTSPSVAFVNVALYFEAGVEPVLIQFTLRKQQQQRTVASYQKNGGGGVWMIDSARKSQKELFVSTKHE